MYIHARPKFGCMHCIEKRGKLYDSEIEIQMDRLHDLSESLQGLLETKDNISDEITNYLYTQLDIIDEVRLKVLEEIGIDVLYQRTNHESTRLCLLGDRNEG